MPLSFDQNPAAYAAGGVEGIGLAEAKVPECRAAESPVKLRDSGHRIQDLLPAGLSVLRLRTERRKPI